MLAGHEKSPGRCDLGLGVSARSDTSGAGGYRLTHYAGARQYDLTTSLPCHCAPQLEHWTSHCSMLVTCSPVLSQTHAVTAGMRLPSSPGVYFCPQAEHGCMSGLRGLVGLMTSLIRSTQSRVTCPKNDCHSRSSIVAHSVRIARSGRWSTVLIMAYWCLIASS